MTKREMERQMHQADTLRQLGFTPDEAHALRRISMTLQRWHEMECGTDNGCVARDEKTDKPYWQSSAPHVNHYPIADREKGALRRLAKIIDRRNMYQAGILEGGKPIPYRPLSFYIQTDPRGAALYIIRPGDVPAGADVSAYYSRGICVY